MKVTSEQLLDLFGFQEEKTLIKVKYVYDNGYCDGIVSEHEIDEVEKLVLVIGTRLYDYEESLKDDLSLAYMGNIVDLIDLQFEIIKQKPTLTEDEKVILRNIGIDFKWIARDCNNMLCWFYGKPTRTHKTDDWWGVKEDDAGTYMFDDLFDFITKNDEEPYNIKELLDENSKRNV